MSGSGQVLRLERMQTAPFLASLNQKIRVCISPLLSTQLQLMMLPAYTLANCVRDMALKATTRGKNRGLDEAGILIGDGLILQQRQ